MKKPVVKVAAGIIYNEFGQIYLTKRLEGKDFAQSWEFPGGKIEENETAEQALKRELEEEVGILALSAVLFEEFEFEYPTKIIHFSFFLVKDWVGEPFGREGQEGFWINQYELDVAQFPPANFNLIQRLLTFNL